MSFFLRKKICIAVIAMSFLAISMQLFFFNKPSISAEMQEELIDSPLTIRGNIPKWLSGTLIRNGPVTVTVDGQTNAHWLDGLAMLHAFSFSNGTVSYTNKFLRTDAYKQVFKKGSLNYDGFAADPCRSKFKNFFTWLVPQSRPGLQNANVNIAKLVDQYVALTETPLPVRFDPQTLNTLGVLEYQDKLPQEKCWESAHPHYDQHTGQTLNYLIQYGRESYYTLYSIGNSSLKRNILAQIPVSEPSYMHSFAVTENYIILTEFPFVVRPLDLLLKGQAFIKNFSWKPERGTQFIVVNRKNGQLIGKYITQPFFAFHHANAFESNESIHIDIVTYDNAEVIMGIADHFKQDSQKSKEIEDTLISSRLDRFVLSPKTGELTSYTLLKECVEFPRINQKFDGKPYQFIYMIDARDPFLATDFRPIYKVNTETLATFKWSEEGCYPGEPVFVAAPNACSEDEGVILSVVVDLFHHNSFLLFLNAQTFQEIGRAVVTHMIPVGLHGQYFQII